MPRTWQGWLLFRNFKMEEVQPDLSNGMNSQVNDANLTIPTDQSEGIVPETNASGKIYKYGLTLEELFNLSLDYYKKGQYLMLVRPMQ